MTNNIFDFLGIDIDTALKNLNELKNNIVNTYNDKVDEIKNNTKKYDLDTQEGYENFINDAAEIRKNLLKDASYVDTLLVKVLDRVVEDVMNKHNSKKTNAEKVKDIVFTEVNRCKSNNESHVNNNRADINIAKDEDNIDWPSRKLSYRQSKNIWKLVDEYMETMVEPHIPENTNQDTIDYMADGLFEFAAWLLNKE